MSQNDPYLPPQGGQYIPPPPPYEATSDIPPESPYHSSPAPQQGSRGLVGWLASAALAVWAVVKYGLLLVVKVPALATLLTGVVSVWAYTLLFPWQVAIGLVVLIFVHEMGHAVALRREGIPAGAPVFIPFVGAFVAMHGQPRDAAVEARVAMAGPITGSLAAWLVLGAGLAWQHPLLVALGHTAVLLNLFNLVPVPPLDGGRIAGAFTRTYWVLGYALGTGALLLTRSPLLLVVLIVGFFTLVRRWRDPVPGYDALSSRQRATIALTYAALVIALLATLPLDH